MYDYAIGQCGIKPAEYWRLSEAETLAIIAGHQRLESYDSEKFRNLFEVLVKHFGYKGDARNLWKLPTDYDNNTKYTPEYLKERNEIALKLADKLGIFKN